MSHDVRHLHWGLECGDVGVAQHWGWAWALGMCTCMCMCTGHEHRAGARAGQAHVHVHVSAEHWADWVAGSAWSGASASPQRRHTPTPRRPSLPMSRHPWSGVIPPSALAPASVQFPGWSEACAERIPTNLVGLSALPHPHPHFTPTGVSGTGRHLPRLDVESRTESGCSSRSGISC